MIQLQGAKGNTLDTQNLTPSVDDNGLVNDNLPLTMLDRCDSCGAQAFVRVTLASGELLFCAHHAAEAKTNLEGLALSWHDESEKLLNR